MCIAVHAGPVPRMTTPKYGELTSEHPHPAPLRDGCCTHVCLSVSALNTLQFLIICMHIDYRTSDPVLGARRACTVTLIHATLRICPLLSLNCCAHRRLCSTCAAGAVSHSAKLVAGLRAVESEEGPGAALFDDPLAGVLAGDEVVRQARDYAMVTLCDPDQAIERCHSPWYAVTLPHARAAAYSCHVPAALAGATGRRHGHRAAAGGAGAPGPQAQGAVAAFRKRTTSSAFM